MSILLLPNLSERIPAGILATMPVKADTAATVPTFAGSAPRYDVKERQHRAFGNC